MGAEAGVKSRPAPELVSIDTNQPGADATIEIAFEVNDPVDGAALNGTTDDNVVITLTGFDTIIQAMLDDDEDDFSVSVTQGGSEVGEVSIASGTIVIGVPDDKDDPILEANVLTTVVISNVEIGNEAVGGVAVHQQPGSAPARSTADPPEHPNGFLPLAFHASVLADPAPEISFTPAAADNTSTMSLTFTIDTETTSGNGVDIMVQGVTIAAGLTPTVAPAMSGATNSRSPNSASTTVQVITVVSSADFADDETSRQLVVSVTGVIHPTGTQKVSATFAHDGQDPGWKARFTSMLKVRERSLTVDLTPAQHRIPRLPCLSSSTRSSTLTAT